MDAMLKDQSIRYHDVDSWVSFGTGAALLLLGARRRTGIGVGLMAASAPLLYRGATGHWPALAGQADTRARLGGMRGVHVREAIRLERPLGDVYRFWRRLENLPSFMTHLRSVEERSPRESHWVAEGPAGVSVEWDAEIINEVDYQTLAWRSLPGGDVVTAGSVTFDTVRGGRSTEVRVHLQYAPPAGKAGDLVAMLFGRAPSQTIREDLRHFKQLLEAGETPRAHASA
jgi:uncharacterized membrane protein